MAFKDRTVEREEYNTQQVELKKKFDEIQKRDGLPCPDTGISHCRSCHGIDSWQEYIAGMTPSCGHTAGCPEC